jgi:enoyl-CoA hydratase/carnithine racemase
VDFEQIQLSVNDRVATITLNRPDKLNAFTGLMAKEVMEAFDQTDANDDVRAVIVTGSGRGFCAGADLSGGSGTFDAGEETTTAHDPRRIRDMGGIVTLRIFESLKPVIGAINGPAVGIGITMTLPMDIRIASSTAKMGFVFARRGIVPEACSSWFLPRIVGISQAAEWCYTGRVFSAEEAKNGGLIRSIHEPNELLNEAQKIGQEIAENTSGVSVAVTRQMLWRMLGADHPMAAHEIDSRVVNQLGRGKDAHEGVQSFLEKRPAVFKDSIPKDLPPVFPWWSEREFM